MNTTFNDKEIEILNGNDINKQKELVKIKVDEFTGSHIEDLCWLVINATKNKNKSTKKDDIDDEKKINNKNEKETGTLSMLLDFDKGKNEHGMCPKGHADFLLKGYGPCIQCGSKDNVRSCSDCFSILCKHCRILNLNKFEYESKIDNIKSNVIRNELVKKPSLSLDVLCKLPRASALDKLMNDIMALQTLKRDKYSLFLIDMDNLKALNSVLGHKGADEVIEHVGLILNHWCTQVNNGKIAGLERGFCFRQGGDEFSLIVKSKYGAYDTNLFDFYMGWKKEINMLAQKYAPNEEDLLKGAKTLKERKKQKIKTALNGIEIDEKTKTNIENAVNDMDIAFNLQQIGVSVGAFIPEDCLSGCEERDWIERAEKAQDRAKDIKGKNEICIYYGKGVVPQNKTYNCLKKGCAEGSW